MATFRHASHFRVLNGILWIIFGFFWKKTVGGTVHLMAVAPNPYGASIMATTSFVCLLSEPDTDQLRNISSSRHVLRGSAFLILTLPSGASVNIQQDVNTAITYLPNRIESQGVFYCEASNRGLTTRVPVTILASNRLLQPSDRQFTVTANIGYSVQLSVAIKNTPGGYSDADIIWEKQGDEVADFEVFLNVGRSLNINRVTKEHAGVYATYWRNWQYNFLGSLIRLIVRECGPDRWGPPSCTGICDNCYYGGMCDDKTGECVCRPGFTGPNCLTVCGENKFGWNCEHQCGAALAVTSCNGSVFCMPDPVGCSCMTGYMGAECNLECPEGKFGAGCTEDCNCAAGSCNRFTGECEGGCYTGWAGTNCQIRDTCPLGYYGTICTDKCYCNNCDKTEGCLDEHPCFNGFWGTKCDKQCANCYPCNKVTGCLYVQCYAGFWGPDCDKGCGCFPCDKLSGCLNVQCFFGLWGQNCETECHCLNGAVCDKETGKCNEDLNSGLALCNPGYVSSTGNNLDNCQKDVGCFADCTKTCHCLSGSDACNTVTGECTGSCSAGWTGASCQTGIVELKNVKTNPDQPLSVTCTVTGNPVVPTEEEVSVYYQINSNAVSATQVQTEAQEMFLTVSYETNPPSGATLICLMMSAFASITPQYYALPRLSKAISVVSKGTTWMHLQWDAWDASAGDTGDGPVVQYKVYNSATSTFIKDGETNVQTPSLIYASITLLTPSTTYRFYVTCVREGQGGEGPPSSIVQATTLAITTQPQPTTAKRPTLSTATTVAPMQRTTKPIPNGISPNQTSPINGIMTNPIDPPSPGIYTMEATSKGMAASSSGSGEELTIIIAVIVVLLFVLIFIVITILFLKRRRNQPKRYPPSVVASEADLDRLSSVFPDSSSIDETHSVSTHNDVDNLALELEEKPELPSRPKSQPAPIRPETPPSMRGRSKSSGMSTASIKIKLRIPPVNIKDYANYVKAKRQTTDLTVEWESLPKDLARPTTIAKKSENKGKNRYRNVVAYDHSRVMLEPLEDDPDSDYINACYIKGINNQKAYIASQGPNDVTVNDLWRMVWEENISVMVMACNVFEEGKLKCTKYWPDRDAPLLSNDISILLNSEEQKEEYYIVRKFIVTKEGEGARELLQFHYTSWPDKDVPKHCTPVLKFIKDVKESHDRKAPLLIHCSAGAGRTGAIIAIHAMMDLADKKGQVDIYNFVFSMRNSRPNIVQTASQYIFVHDAMLEYLFCKNTFIEASMFASRLKSLLEQNPESGMTKLQDEYEILNLVSPNFGSERTRGSLKPDSLAKLRSGDSVPVDSSRPYLMTQRDDGDMSPYINAAFMDGYKKKDLFISTQMPMAHTVVDLWRMMYDYNCTCIVMLNAMEPDDEENCPQFWPDAGTGEFGPFTVSLLDKESTPDFEMKTLQLVYTKRDVKSPIPVRHFQYTTWPKDDERPATSHGILQLISEVEKWQKTLEEPGPIVVLCMNAAGRSGTFCTIQTALDQVREEQGVDVLQNVKQLRIHRTNMVDTAAKYLFCYTTILEYLKAFDDYSSKKDYQNMPDFSKQKKQKKEKKKTEEVIYGNIPQIAAGNDSKTQSEPAQDTKPEEAVSAPENSGMKPSNESDVKGGAKPAKRGGAPKVAAKSARKSKALSTLGDKRMTLSSKMKAPSSEGGAVGSAEEGDKPSESRNPPRVAAKSARKSKALSTLGDKRMTLSSERMAPSSEGDAMPSAEGGAKPSEGGGVPEDSLKDGKRPAKKNTHKPEQIYQNVMHDTQL